jgi:hypothetical protein
MITELAVSADDTTINSKPTLTVSGKADFTITATSCFKINYAQPYVESETKYNANNVDGSWDPFYVPFPASEVAAIVTSTPAGATIKRLDDFTVEATITADSTTFSFDITGFVNPFSQVKDSSASSSKFHITHWKDCSSSVPTACDPETCRVSAPDFTGPS